MRTVATRSEAIPRLTLALALVLVLVLVPGLPLAVGANEALDILEGRTNVEDVELPPLPEGEQAEAETGKVTHVPADWAPSPLDPVWSRAILYDDPDNPWIQQLALMGMFHFSGAWGTAEVEGAQDLELDTTRTRRARLGARLRVFGNTEIEAVGEFAGDVDYQRLERLKARTFVLPNHYIEYGKFRPHFGIEGSKDPQQLLTPERALLSSMVMPASTLGLAFGQDCAPWDWSIGWFSGDNDRYFPGVEGNGFIAASIAYEGAERLQNGETMSNRWYIDYIYNMDGLKSRSLPRYNVAGLTSANGRQAIMANPAFRHLFAAGVELEADRYAFEGEFMVTNGALNAWGLTLTPSVWAVPGTLKLVARYHYADTDKASALVGGLGVGGDPLYDSSPLFIGDEFHSFYLGANVHLYQDRMVLLNGLEYAIMADDAGAGFETDAWIWHTGARVSF